MENIKIKQLLNQNLSPMRFFGVDMFASLFRGSFHTRKYYSSSSDFSSKFDEEPLKVRPDALFLLEQELSFHKQVSVLGIDQNPDFYHPDLYQPSFTKQFYQLIKNYRIGLFIETSCDNILKDIDILSELNQKIPLVVALAFSPINYQIHTKIDPFALNENALFKVVAKLRQAQITAGIIMKPIIPFINDSENLILDFINQAQEASASFIYPSFGIILNKNQNHQFYQLIETEIPGLKNIYLDNYGFKKSWQSPKATNLKKTFVIAAKKAKIVFSMNEISKLLRPVKVEQLKLL